MLKTLTSTLKLSVSFRLCSKYFVYNENWTRWPKLNEIFGSIVLWLTLKYPSKYKWAYEPSWVMKFFVVIKYIIDLVTFIIYSSIHLLILKGKVYLITFLEMYEWKNYAFEFLLIHDFSLLRITIVIEAILYKLNAYSRH